MGALAVEPLLDVAGAMRARTGLGVSLALSGPIPVDPESTGLTDRRCGRIRTGWKANRKRASSSTWARMSCVAWTGSSTPERTSLAMAVRPPRADSAASFGVAIIGL